MSVRVQALVRGRPWTEREEEFILDHFKVDLTPAEIARALGRPLASVRAWLKRHGLWRRSSRCWTTKQDAVLRAGWGQVRTREIVRQRAGKLGLDAGRYYTDEEKELVRQLYPTHTAAQISERIHGTVHSASAIYRLAFALGLRKWPSWPPEVIARVRRRLGR